MILPKVSNLYPSGVNVGLIVVIIIMVLITSLIYIILYSLKLLSENEFGPKGDVIIK